MNLPLSTYRDDHRLIRREKFDTSNLRAVKPGSLEAMKHFLTTAPELPMLTQFLYNLEKKLFSEDEIYTLIAFLRPDLESYKNEPLLHHRYCIPSDDPCYNAVNDLPASSMISKVNHEEGCVIDSYNLRLAQNYQNTSISPVCFNHTKDTFTIEVDRKECSDFVEVSGVPVFFRGLYRRGEFEEHGRPVYDGPGDSALSWTRGHWWITLASEVGVNNGYAYVAEDVTCPGDGQTLRRGGTDEDLPGEQIANVDVHPEWYDTCPWDLEVKGLNQYNGTYHRQRPDRFVAGRPSYRNVDDKNLVVAWDGRYNHWGFTDLKKAGTNTGFAYMESPDNRCPGGNGTVIKAAGSDELIIGASLLTSGSNLNYF